MADLPEDCASSDGRDTARAKTLPIPTSPASLGLAARRRRVVGRVPARIGSSRSRSSWALLLPSNESGSIWQGTPPCPSGGKVFTPHGRRSDVLHALVPGGSSWIARAGASASPSRARYAAALVDRLELVVHRLFDDVGQVFTMKPPATGFSLKFSPSSLLMIIWTAAMAHADSSVGVVIASS